MENKILNAIGQVIQNDLCLVENKMEWATAHRIAVYLENQFHDWNIDCEYNKMTRLYTSKHDSNRNHRRPDIVIHKRGETSLEKIYWLLKSK